MLFTFCGQLDMIIHGYICMRVLKFCLSFLSCGLMCLFLVASLMSDSFHWAESHSRIGFSDRNLFAVVSCGISHSPLDVLFRGDR